MSLFAVLGATGQTGGATARHVMANGHKLRVVLRDLSRGEDWSGQGAEVVEASVDDGPSLIGALEGAEAAFLMNPPAYADPDPFAVAARRAENFAQAIEASSVRRVVLLSSISAHLPAGNGMIHTNHLFERRLERVGKPVTFLRPGYFLENWVAVRGAVLGDTVLPSMLSPLDRSIPMVATEDIGALAARLLAETWQGRRIVELAGQTNLSPEGVAGILGRQRGKAVKAVAVPRAEWAPIFAGGGMSPAAVGAMLEMFDGFNSGTIRFQGAEPRRGAYRHEDVLETIFSTED